ncbi:CTD small phosphatase-like protein 2, partial [Trifolium medium]|nr:CTD small phosphatase-like protein 2 [Trifolium medium]
MVAKSATTCRQDGRYPHVSHKSNKISKRSCSMVGVIDEMEHLDISSQISHNGGFFVNKESSKERANEEHQMSSDIDTTAGQNCTLFNGCADSTVQT